MAPKSAKGHSDAGSIFDIKKPDLSPVEKKLAAEDEGSLVEALAMLHAVPHTDGFKDKLLLSGALEKMVSFALSSPSPRVRLMSLKACGYYATWERDVSKYVRRPEIVQALLKPFKEALDLLFEAKEAAAGAQSAPDPKVKGAKVGGGGGAAALPYEATPEAAECALRALQLYLLAAPGATREALLVGRTLEEVVDVGDKIGAEDPSGAVRQRLVNVLQLLVGQVGPVKRVIQAGALPILWAQAMAESQGVDARLPALQCLAGFIQTQPHVAQMLMAVAEGAAGDPTAAAAATGATLVRELLDTLLIKDPPAPPPPAAAKGAPPPADARPPEAPRDMAVEALKGAATSLLASVLERSDSAAHQLAMIGGDVVLRAVLPQPPEDFDPTPGPSARNRRRLMSSTGRETPSRPGTSQGVGAAPQGPPGARVGRASTMLAKEMPEPSPSADSPALIGLRGDQKLPLPERPCGSFVAQAAALHCLAHVLRLPGLRQGILAEEAWVIHQLATAPPPPQPPPPPPPGSGAAAMAAYNQAVQQAHAAAAAHFASLPTGPKVALATHLLFLLTPQPESPLPASIVTGAALAFQNLVLDTHVARRVLERPVFLALVKEHLTTLTSGHTLLASALLTALAVICHQADRRTIEEEGFGDAVIEAAKAVGPDAPPVLRRALGQCVMVVNPEYPLRPPALAAYSAPSPPSFDVPPLWDILADVSLQERSSMGQA